MSDESKYTCTKKQYWEHLLHEEFFLAVPPSHLSCTKQPEHSRDLGASSFASIGIMGHLWCMLSFLSSKGFREYHGGTRILSVGQEPALEGHAEVQSTEETCHKKLPLCKRAVIPLCSGENQSRVGISTNQNTVLAEKVAKIIMTYPPGSVNMAKMWFTPFGHICLVTWECRAAPPLHASLTTASAEKRFWHSVCHVVCPLYGERTSLRTTSLTMAWAMWQESELQPILAAFRASVTETWSNSTVHAGGAGVGTLLIKYTLTELERTIDEALGCTFLASLSSCCQIPTSCPKPSQQSLAGGESCLCYLLLFWKAPSLLGIFPNQPQAEEGAWKFSALKS